MSFRVFSGKKINLLQFELLHCQMVEGKVEGNKDCVTLFAGLFTEFEFDRTIMEVFQKEDTVQ